MAKSVIRGAFESIAASAEELETDGFFGGGSVAALVAAQAASLAAAAADRSRGGWEQAGGARAQAQALRRRAIELAERNAAAYGAAREALSHRRRGAEGEPSSEQQAARDWRLGAVVEEAAGPPLELAASAADIAELAAEISARGTAEVRADAAIAAVLAAAAARAAAQLVEINLVVGQRESSVRARAYAEAAAAAAAAASAP